MGADTGEKVRVLDASNNRSNAGVKINNTSNNEESGKGEGWENIPPYRQLKLLLVEDDDSTRHVVAALLRNCGYQVVLAANGLQAWTMLLDEQSRQFDLVLTDVVMPGLSGMGLLSRIMHRESLKKIPVVMMSSHDSTEVVFKCLSKGAADFLVKPVRKNELKHLWQHAWRRRQSSSGCESETGKLTCGGSENGESGSEDVRVSDQSDNGSAAQSSCTNKVLMELGSPRRSRQANVLKGKRSSRRNRDSQTVEELNDGPKHADVEEEGITCEQSMPSDQPAVQLVDLIGTIASEQAERRREHYEDESEMDGSNNTPELLKDSSSDPTSTSKLELSLRSSSAVDNHSNVFRQSGGGASAFSRYNTPREPQPQPQQQQQQQHHHSQLHEHTQEHTRRRELTVELNRNSDEGMCSSPGKRVFPCPEQRAVAAPVNFPVHYATLVSYDHQSSMALPGTTYYYAQPALPPWQHAFSPQRKEADMTMEEQQQQQQQRNFQAFTNMMAHHHHYHIEHHHQRNSNVGAAMNNNPFMSASRDVSPACMEAPGCGSTNAAESGKQFNNGFSGSSHGNGSVSGNGSNNVSNGFNHSSMNTNTITNNNNNVGAGNGCGDSGSGNFNSPSGAALVSPGGTEQNRVRREAALNKFRLKRKERCFEKKVRYQSRKRLAEQRPRVRGQFVSQSVYDSAVNHVADS